jgi:hypothetical protein
MEYCGRSARVPLGNGKWSRFMPIPDAQQYEHTLKVQASLNMLRAGKQIIGLRNDIPAMEEAREMYAEERESAANTLTQAD